MASVFTRVLSGELPGRFVYRDERAAAFLTIAPLAMGHTLVVPQAEIDDWLDLPDELAAHLFLVARKVGRAVQEAFQPARVGLMIAGMEVPHVHLHVVPIASEKDLELSRADPHPDPAAMDDAAARIRAALGTSTTGEPLD